MTVVSVSDIAIRLRSIVTVAILLLAAACGGGGGGSGSASPPPAPPPPTTYTVGGTVTGLTGTGLVLQNNGGDNRAITANGAFSFATSLSSGAAYSVTMTTRPSAPSQACLIFNGAGNVASANVTGINVVCGPAPGKSLYVTFDNPVILRGYTINALTGALTPITGSTAPSGSNAGQPLASPNGQLLYTANASQTISAYSINATTGALTEIAGSPFAVGAAPGSIAFRPDGAFLYVARHDSLISTFSVHATTGALTPVGTPQAVAGNSQLIIDPAGKLLYAASGISDQLHGFAINATTGALTAVPNSPYTAARGYAALGNAGSVLYLSKPTDNTPSDNSAVLAYRIDGTTGALTPVAGSPFAAGVAGGKLQLSPNGQLLFVANATNGGGTITSFVVNPTTGALTAAPSPSIQLGSGSVIYDVDPSGRYIAGFTFFGSAASLLTVNPTTGALTATVLPPFGYSPLTALLDRSGLFGYVLGYGAGNIHAYQIDPIGLDIEELPTLNNGVAARLAVIVGSQ